jgi:CubicO group peptidase (beta-lactamase class C family)
MARYAAFHAAGDQGDGRLLTPATFQKLHTDVANQGYAMGWVVLQRTWADGTVLQHTGSNLQWLTSVWLGPNKRFGVVVVINVAGTPAQNAANAAVTLAIQQFL